MSREHTIQLTLMCIGVQHIGIVNVAKSQEHMYLLKPFFLNIFAVIFYGQHNYNVV